MLTSAGSRACLVAGQVDAKAALHPTSFSAERQAGVREPASILFIFSRLVSEIRGVTSAGVLANTVEQMLPV